MKPTIKKIEKCAKCKKISKQYNWSKISKDWVCNDCFYKEKK